MERRWSNVQLSTQVDKFTKPSTMFVQVDTSELCDQCKLSQL